MKTEQQTQTAILDKIVSLLDSAVRIPGTNIRFGLDALIGLIPGVGDSATFLISGILVMAMAKKGITRKIALQMVGNIAIDYLVGTIPILGDLFDVGFKANQRNLELLKKHQESHKNKDIKVANAKGILIMIALFLVAFLIVAGYITIKVGKIVLGIFA